MTTAPAIAREKMLSKSTFGFYSSVDALTELKARFHQYIEERIQGVNQEVEGRWDNSPGAILWGEGEVEGFQSEKKQWTQKIDEAIAEWNANKGFRGPTYIEAGIHAATRCGVTQKWTVALI